MNTTHLPKHVFEQFMLNALKHFARCQLHLIPRPIFNLIFAKAFNHALNQPLKAGEFDFLHNRWLTIKISDFEFQWSMTLKNQQFILSHNIKSDAVLSGDSQALLMIAAQVVDADTLFFQRRLTIEGDTEFALEVKNTLDAVDRDELALIYQAPLHWLETALKNKASYR